MFETLEDAAREVLRIVEGNGGLQVEQQLGEIEYSSGLQRIAPLLREALDAHSKVTRDDVLAVMAERKAEHPRLRIDEAEAYRIEEA